MGIINVTPGQVGLVGVLPSIAYINTDDTIAEVTTTGYLNKEVANGLQISLPCIAAVSTKATPTSAPQVGWYQVSHSGANWSLVIGSNEVIALPNGQILVGNASNIATPVAMTGDISITNAGVTAIVAGVIVNADINAAAAIAFSKLAALPSAQILVGSAGNVATAVAMSGDVTISNTGVTSIAALSIVNADISASAAIDYSKLAALTSGNILVGSAGNVATSVAMSKDATISNTGAFTLSSALIQVVRTTISAAQWNGMYVTPFLLVPAKGAGTQIVVHAIDAVMTFVSAQYADGGAIHAQYGSTTLGAGTKATGTIAAATVNGFAASSSFQLQGAQAGAANTTMDNLGIWMSNDTGAFTTGDGTWVIDVWYSVKAA